MFKKFNNVNQSSRFDGRIPESFVFLLILMIVCCSLVIPVVEFVRPDIDGKIITESKLNFSDYIKVWIDGHGLNRTLGEAIFYLVYQIPGFTSFYKWSALLSIFSRYVFIVIAARILGIKKCNHLSILTLSLITPFWLDSGLLLARSVNELISVLVVWFVFHSKSQSEVDLKRIFIFCVLQVLTYEAFLIPMILVIWFGRKEQGKNVIFAFIGFIVLYFFCLKVGLLINPKMAAAVRPADMGIVVGGNEILTVKYASKSEQFQNTLRSMTWGIAMAAALPSLMFLFFCRIWLKDLGWPKGLRSDVFKILKYTIFAAMPVLANLLVSIYNGSQGRVYWVMLSYWWMLLILLCVKDGVFQNFGLWATTFSLILFASICIVIDLRIDLLQSHFSDLSGKFFRGFTSHFGLY